MKQFISIFSIILFLCSCSKSSQPQPQQDEKEKQASLYLTYSLPSNNGTPMAVTKTTHSEVFNEFYNEMKSGAMIAPSYELTFTETTSNATCRVTGTWSGNNKITLRTGKYKVYGKSTASGDNIQDKCSIIIDDEVVVDASKTSITLKAFYDCSLVVFSDASISSLSNFNGLESKSFFKFKTYFYAFVNSTLYNSNNKDNAYIEGTKKDNGSFKVYTGNLSFQKGKYYIYNNLVTDFDLPIMDEGGFDVDLSVSGTANCYIISYAGSFKFRADVMGNSSEPIGGTPSKAEVLWESFGTSTVPNIGDIISSVNYKDGFIFIKTPNNLVDGNALIVLKDVSNKILWSWHIWVCKDFDPVETEQVYGNNTGIIMMDRNLGALTNEKGNVKSYGLFYQWGRKDPFIGNTKVASLSLTTFPTCVAKSSTTGTIEYSIKNPHTIIYGGGYDWSNAASADRWENAKTKYDPCPYGWRVATGGTNGVWATGSGYTSSFSKQYDTSLQGVDLSDEFKYSNVWYPCAGFRESTSGAYNGEGYDFNVWSCNSINTNNAYFFDFNKPNTILTSAGNNATGSKSYVRNVRCQRIIM